MKLPRKLKKNLKAQLQKSLAQRGAVWATDEIRIVEFEQYRFARLCDAKIGPKAVTAFRLVQK